MTSTLSYSPPATLSEEPDEQHQGSSTEPLASSSASQVLDQPPQTPLKDRDSVGRLTEDPTLPRDSPAAYTTILQDSTSPMPSQLVEFNSVAQTTLTAAAELIAGNVNRPEDAPTPTPSRMTNAGSLVNQPTATGHDSTYIDTNPYASGSTSNVTNPNLTRARPNTATTSGTSGGVINTVHYHPDRSQTLLSSRPLSPERRQSGYEPISYDPIRGDVPVQMYLPGGSGNGGGDPIGMPNQLGSRDSTRRTGVPRPRPVFNPTDGTLAGGNGPGSRRASRTMSGNDWLPDVPLIEEPLPPREKTVEDRLRPTIEAATMERDKYQKRSRQQRLLINGAIGLQVAVGAVTTGVAAAGTHIGAAVASLGAISTILASYLAKVRGSGEPEFSTIHARELNTFLRDIEGFIMDHGHEVGAEQDDKILMYRERFEAIIKTDGEDSRGGTGNSQRYLSTPYPPFAQPPLSHPPHVLVTSAPGVVDEKQQMWRNEKAVSGMV